MTKTADDGYRSKGHHRSYAVPDERQEDGETFGPMGAKLLDWIWWSGIAIWVGSMVSISFIAAPAAFDILKEPKLAGSVVGEALDRFYILGYCVGAGLIVIEIIKMWNIKTPWRREILVIFLLIMMIGMNGYAREVVASRMASIREAAERIEDLAQSDPRKLAFDRLHRRSVQLMTASMIAGLILIYVRAEGRRRDGRRR